jgi:hypothetical protein
MAAAIRSTATVTVPARTRRVRPRTRTCNSCRYNRIQRWCHRRLKSKSDARSSSIAFYLSS